MGLQIVWFKRDLRLEDHAALAAAALRGPVLPLLIVEPDYWKQPDVSARQWRFWRGCLIALGCFLPWVWGLHWPEPYLLVLGVLLTMSCLVDLRVARTLNLPNDWTRMRIRLSLGLGLATFMLGLV